MHDSFARPGAQDTATLKARNPNGVRLALSLRVSTLAIFLAIPGIASTVAADPIAVHVGEPDLSPEKLQSLLNLTQAYVSDFDPNDNATVILEKFNAFLAELKDAVLGPANTICIGDGGRGWTGLTAKVVDKSVEALLPTVANYGHGYEPAKAHVKIDPRGAQACGRFLSLTVGG